MMSSCFSSYSNTFLALEIQFSRNNLSKSGLIATVTIQVQFMIFTLYESDPLCVQR